MKSRDLDAIELEQRRPIENRWALIVGISTHKYRIGDLNYAHRDAEEFYKLLQLPSAGGFDAKHILLLTNEKATNPALNRALQSFLRKPGPNDLVIIYFACHGFRDPDRAGVVYFVTHDTDPDDIPGTAVPMRHVELALRDTLRASRVVVIADTCHSAAIALNSVHRSVVPDAQVINKYLEEISTARPGVALLTSATASESAKEGAEWGGGHGVFTHFLLEGLRGGADGYKSPRDGKVTLGELFDYVRDNVQRATNDSQHPVIGHSPFDRKLTMAFTGGMEASALNEVGLGLLRLAQVEREPSAFRSAGRHFAEAVEQARMMGGDYQDAELGLSRALAGEGALDQAGEWLHKVAAQGSQRDGAYWELAVAWACASDRESANFMFSQFMKNDNADSRCALARAYIGSRAPRRVALLIGVDEYATRSGTFPACRADVERMGRLLRSIGFETVELCGDVANRDALLCNELYDVLDLNDQLIIFYSGNGKISRTIDERVDAGPYLALYDHVLDTEQGTLTANELFATVSGIRARTLLILDTDCSSVLVERVRKQSTFDVMFAAGPRQSAYVDTIKGEQVGRFTYALCESVRDVKLSQLTYGEWFGRARQSMRDLGFQPAQVPLFLGDHRARVDGSDFLSHCLDQACEGVTMGVTASVLRRRYSMLCDSSFSMNAAAHVRFAYDFMDRKLFDEARSAFAKASVHGSQVAGLGMAIVQALVGDPGASHALREASMGLPSDEAALVAELADAVVTMDCVGARRALIVVGDMPNDDVDASMPHVERLRHMVSHQLRLREDDIVMLTGAEATARNTLDAITRLLETSNVPVLFYYSGKLATPRDALVLHGTPKYLLLADVARLCSRATKWVTVLDARYEVRQGGADQELSGKSASVGSRDVSEHDGQVFVPQRHGPQIGSATLFIPRDVDRFESLHQSSGMMSWEGFLQLLGPVEIVGESPTGPFLRDFSGFWEALHRYRTHWQQSLRALLGRVIADREKSAPWPEGRADLARVLAAMGKHEKAAEEYRRVCRVLEEGSAAPSSNAELQLARRGLGLSLLHGGINYTEAVSVLSSVAEACPADAGVHYYLARAIRLMVQRETLDKANQAFERYRDLGGPLGELADIVSE